MTAISKISAPTSDGATFAERHRRTMIAFRDLAEGIARRWIWTAIAWQELRQRYRGSILGPFWLTITTLITVGAMGILYSHLLNTNINFYIPYLTTGLVLWQFVSFIILDACDTFNSMRGVILQIPMPFSVYVYRVVWRNLIALGHNLLLVPFVLVIFHTPVDWHLVLFLPALLLVSLNGVWVCLVLGLVCARFADVKQIVASVLQVLFFVTPIFWSADALGRWRILAELNPLFAAVDIIRAPLLGLPFAPYSWLVATATLVIGSAIAFAAFAHFRARIAYWV
jgi:ABC-type polysaccharide/polyol phosphate export permease